MKRISNKVKNSVLLVMVVVFIAIIIVSIYEINIDRSWRLAYKRECEMEKYCENMVAIFSAQYSRLIASGMGADEANAQAVADVFTSYRGGKEIYSIFATSDSILFYMNGDKKNDLSGYSSEEWIEQ